MKTNVWGPHAWRFLHAVSFEYPEQPTAEQQEAARQLFTNLQHLLPCKECCAHYAQGLSKHPVEPHLHSRDALSRWVHALHNRVNAALGKQQIEYDQVQREYMNDEFSCTVDESCHGEPSASAKLEASKLEPTASVKLDPSASAHLAANGKALEKEAKHAKNHTVAFFILLAVLLASIVAAYAIYKSR